MSDMRGGDKARNKANKNLQKAFKKSNNMNHGKGCVVLLLIMVSLPVGATAALIELWRVFL